MVPFIVSSAFNNYYKYKFFNGFKYICNDCTLDVVGRIYNVEYIDCDYEECYINILYNHELSLYFINSSIDKENTLVYQLGSYKTPVIKVSLGNGFTGDSYRKLLDYLFNYLKVFRFSSTKFYLKDYNCLILEYPSIENLIIDLIWVYELNMNIFSIEVDDKYNIKIELIKYFNYCYDIKLPSVNYSMLHEVKYSNKMLCNLINMLKDSYFYKDTITSSKIELVNNFYYFAKNNIIRFIMSMDSNYNYSIIVPFKKLKHIWSNICFINNLNNINLKYLRNIKIFNSKCSYNNSTYYIQINTIMRYNIFTIVVFDDSDKIIYESNDFYISILDSCNYDLSSSSLALQLDNDKIILIFDSVNKLLDSYILNCKLTNNPFIYGVNNYNQEIINLFNDFSSNYDSNDYLVSLSKCFNKDIFCVNNVLELLNLMQCNTLYTLLN